MAKAKPDAGEDSGARVGVLQRIPRWLAWVGAALGAVVVAGFLGLLALNTGPGRAFLVDRIADIRPASGLAIKVGRIDGSLFGRMTVRQITLADPKGAFVEIPSAVVDWRPLALLGKKVDLRELTVPQVRVLLRPGLNKTPSDPNKPLLPDIRIAAPRVNIERIVFDEAVTGRRHIATLSGAFQLADGRLQADVAADALRAQGVAGGDRLRAKIDVLPRANRLLTAVDLRAPQGGLLDSYLHLDAPLALTVGGQGDWRSWTGKAQARLGETEITALDLTARSGRFGVRGQVSPAALLKGAARNLVQPAVSIDADGTLRNRRLAGRIALASDAMTMTANGGIDLGSNRLDDVQIEAKLLKPATLAANLSGRDVRLNLGLDGSLKRLRVDYDLQAAFIGVGKIRVENLSASGRSRVTPDRIMIPVNAKVGRLSGLNAAAGGLLTNIVLSGDLAYGNGRLMSDNLRLRSDRIDATAIIMADPASGQYTGALKGRVNDYAVDGVGRFDLVTDARLTTGRSGGFGLQGSVSVKTKRIDNKALNDLLGGEGLLTAKVALAPAGEVTVSDLRLTAPDFQILSGGGSYRPDGRIDFRAAARSTRYGPLAVTASGTVERPVVRLTAASPNVGIPLQDVVVEVVGGDQGYRANLRGRSAYGPFSGEVTLRPGSPLTIEVASLTALGVTASGQLTQTSAGPLAGSVQIKGSGLNGAVRLSAAGAVQRLDIDMTAKGASLALEPTVMIGDGKLTATALLNPQGPQVNGDLSVTNVRRGDVAVTAARLRGTYQDGKGQIGLVANGRAAAPFTVAVQASLAPELIRANLQGEFSRVKVRFEAPAEIRKTGAGWKLTPLRVLLPGGDLVLSGETGGETQVEARLRNVDLALVQSLYPDLALEGSVTGKIDARLPRGAIPVVNARLDVDGFSRVGLATESPPVDVAVRGALSNSGGDVQAIVRRGSATIGRLQARMAPLAPGAGPWTTRLAQAPLAGGIRYNGPSDVLWAMTGISGHAISGPVNIAADFGGRLQQPTLNGVLRADALRYANPTYATVISNIAVRGRFTQSRLELTSLTGRAGRGSVTATGWVGLDAAAGFPMELRATLNGAQLADSDSLGASVSGSLAVTNNRESGALIKGQLSIPEARYRIVRQGAADVVTLEGVRRTGSVAPAKPEASTKETPTMGPPQIWRLDIGVRAGNRIFIEGMGLEAELSANIHVGGDSANPNVTGNLGLVRGTYSFAGRRLDLQKVDVRFDGREATNPIIDIAASSTVEGVTATVNATGRAQNPQISFTSTPALPQDEVLSRLLFGASVGQLSPTQAIQVAAALNGLRNGGGGLDPLGKLRSVAGIDRLRILGADQASGRGASLAAGAYVGRNVYVEIITDTRGFTATQIEIALSKTLSLLTQVGSFGGSSVELQYSRDY